MIKPLRFPYKPKHFLGGGSLKNSWLLSHLVLDNCCLIKEDVEWLSTHMNLGEIVIYTRTY